MKTEVSLYFSHQAELMLKNMPQIDKNELVEWFISIRKINIGGGDVTEFLRYKEEQVKKSV